MVGDRDGGKREGGVGIAHFTFLILTVWGAGGEMTSQDWWQKFIFFNWQNGFSGFEDHLAIESKVKKKI